MAVKGVRSSWGDVGDEFFRTRMSRAISLMS